MMAADNVASDSLNLIADSSETLRHRIVNVMGEALAFPRYGVCFPLLDSEVSELGQKTEGQCCSKQHAYVPRSPPRRPGQHLGTLYGSRIPAKLQVVVPNSRRHADIAPRSSCVQRSQSDAARVQAGRLLEC